MTGERRDPRRPTEIENVECFDSRGVWSPESGKSDT